MFSSLPQRVIIDTLVIDETLAASGRFFNIEEAAHMLGVSEKTLRAMCRDGRITAQKLNGSRRWKISEVELTRILNGWKEQK